MLNGRQDVDRQVLSSHFGGAFSGNRFGPTNCLFVQLPLVNGFLASLSRQVSIQLSFRFIEGVFGIHPGAVGRVIRFFHFHNEESCFRINGLRHRFCLPTRCSAARFRRQLFVDGFYVTAPARLNGLVQFVQGRVSLVCGLPYAALVKQPLEHRPFHRLHHQRLGLFDFGELSHGAKTIARDKGIVQRGGGGVISRGKAIAVSP